MTPGSTSPIELIPALKYIPSSLRGARWKLQADRLKKLQLKYYHQVLDDCRMQTKAHDKNGCFMEEIFEMHGLTDEILPVSWYDRW